LHRRLKDKDKLLVFDPMQEHSELGTLYLQALDYAADVVTLGAAAVPEIGLLMRGIHLLAGRPLGSLWRPRVADRAIDRAVQETVEPASDVDRVIVQDPDDIDWFLGGLVEMAEGYTVAVDEAHLYWHNPLLAKQIFTMRHRRQDWWIITQRVANAPHAILSQLDKVVCFNMWWVPDLEMMQERFGLDPEELKNLTVGQYVERNVNLIAGDEQ